MESIPVPFQHKNKSKKGEGKQQPTAEEHELKSYNNDQQQKDGQMHKHVPLVPVIDYESLDYDRSENVPYKEWVDGFSSLTYFHVSVMRWILVGVIGILTGITAFLINLGVYYLTMVKYISFQKVYELVQDNGMIFLGLLVLLGFNVFYGFIAGILVAFKPIAAGSGIPEIKCYLNGIIMPQVVRIQTLLAKTIGVLFSVAGGFLVGKEGPMIHSGAIIGSGIPQLRSFVLEKLKLPYPYFRSDKDKRDFVSCGAAAGVAAAFGAPIGGVLFSLEEGSSFWDQWLTWRSLFCAMCSTLTLNLLLSASPITDATFGELDRPGLINFGRFDARSENLWTIWYIFVFAAMGAFGGLMGAWFNSLNKHLTIYRMNNIKSHVFKLLEVILIAITTTFSVFFLSTFLGMCVPVVSGDYAPDVEPLNGTQDYFCPTKGLLTTFVSSNFSTSTTEFFNDMATLLFNSEEEAIKQLFHQNGAFTLATLAIALIVYFFIACWTYGASIPSGIFVPCLTIGALYGRFIVTALILIGLKPHIYAGTFALIGAASFLGGVVRMTVSLTVILIETTDEIEYGLPLLITLLMAKWVGDFFNEGLYDIHIELKEIPLLGWGSPKQMDKLNASDVMKRDLKYVRPISSVNSIVNLLQTTKHNAFIVATPVNETEFETMDQSTKNVPPQSTASADKSPKLYSRRSIQSVNRATALAVRKQRDAMMRSSQEINSTNIATPDSNNKDSRSKTNEETPLIFHGIILRSQLVTLLHNRITSCDTSTDNCHMMSYLDLTADYPRYKSISDICEHLQIRDDETMDVSIYMNPSPYVVFHHARLPRVFNIFRTMGLRHLPVMDEAGIVVGIITRHDLTHEHLHHVMMMRRNRKKSVVKKDQKKQQENFPAVVAADKDGMITGVAEITINVVTESTEQLL